MKRMICEMNNMEYVVRYPDSFEAGGKHPVILALHGADTRGADINKLLNHPLVKSTEEIKDFPFILVAPLCSENTWFDMWPTLKALVREIISHPRMDESRIYLMGNSMGGYAAWQLAMSMPEAFAAAAPICGGGMYWNADRLISVPVWAFHGEQDPIVYPDESKKMVDAVNRAGGSAKLTIYPGAGHDVWTAACSDPALYEWFLSHINANPRSANA